MPQDIQRRVANLEIASKLQDQRLENVELQIARITSHIESEVGLARNDLARIERRLFGDEDKEYGGRLGELAARQNTMEVWFKSIIGASGIIGFLIGFYYFLQAIA